MLAFLAVSALLCLPAAPQTELPRLLGTVTRVVDGDTIDVALASGQIRVRLHAIDTPERGQAWFREATDALRRLVDGKSVELEPFEQDRYERLIARVFIGNRNVNAELVREGHAWAFRRYMRREDASLCDLEHEARQAQRGLWSLPREMWVAPWSKRRGGRAYETGMTAAQCRGLIGLAR